TAEQAKDRAGHLGHPIDRRGTAVSGGSDRSPVEADHPGQSDAIGSLLEGQSAAEAKANREEITNRASVGAKHVRGCRRYVGVQRRGTRLRDVRLPLEIVFALTGSGGSPEVV